MSHRTIVFISTLTLFISIRADANMRAPFEEETKPSSALRGAKPELTVMYETLKFSCAARQCAVEARYEIRASASTTVSLDFVTPSTQGITVQVNEEKVPTKIKKDVSFQAELLVGTNYIAVSYKQPLGIYESSYGYYQSSAYVYTLPYDLYPLNEWKRDDAFKLDIEVSYRNPNRGFFSRLFGSIDIFCNRRKPNQHEDKGDLVTASFQFVDNPLPKSLNCAIDADAPEGR